MPAQSGPPAGVSADTLYSNAVRDNSTGKYDLALQEFSDYLKYFPTTAFAANAQYYIGDINYRRNDYTNALQAFDAVLERFPDGSKTADAHYMKGLCYDEAGQERLCRALNFAPSPANTRTWIPTWLPKPRLACGKWA